MRINPDFWRGRSVLLTGHTGFKGSWLTLWLQRLGAHVSALALAPDETPCLYCLAAIRPDREMLADIGEPEPIAALMQEAQPSVVIHMAAQALVRRSYRDPLATLRTNILGTAHVLEAARHAPSVEAVLVVTSDKVYENEGFGRPFGEDDRLGGRDPYSASKACAELVAASFRHSFFAEAGAPAIATARAGNVVGGGDWSADRLVPDIVRARATGEPAMLRYPAAVRPWQHVLEPLAGYLMLAEALVRRPNSLGTALNFAPAPGNFRTVADLVEVFDAAAGGDGKGWVAPPGARPYEASVLTLSADRAAAQLGWRPLLDFAETIGWTAEWYRGLDDGQDARSLTLAQIDAYTGRLDAVSAAARERKTA